jgi:hypothetical protein
VDEADLQRAHDGALAALGPATMPRWRGRLWAEAGAWAWAWASDL